MLSKPCAFAQEALASREVEERAFMLVLATVALLATMIIPGVLARRREVFAE